MKKLINAVENVVREQLQGMALANHRLAKDVESVALITNEEHTFLSSTTVREIAMLDGDISSMVPGYVQVRQAGQWFNWLSLPVEAIPNLAVFLMLVAQARALVPGRDDRAWAHDVDTNLAALQIDRPRARKRPRLSFQLCHGYCSS